jgi:hypothetical protein
VLAVIRLPNRSTMSPDDADDHHDPGDRQEQVKVLSPLGLVDRMDDAPEHRCQERD